MHNPFTSVASFKTAVIALGVAVGLAQAAPARAQGKRGDGNSLTAKQRYKQHIKRAKAFVTLDQFDQAANEFLAAYKLDAKPSLLYNAAHAYWLGDNHDKALEYYERYLQADPAGSVGNQARQRFFEVAERRWQAGQLEPALQLYAKYVQLAPGGANLAQAQMRFFEAAEKLWHQGQRDQTEEIYQRFLEYRDKGQEADQANARLAELANERARLEAEAQREADSGAATGVVAPLVAPPVDRPASRRGYRFGFWVTLGIAAIGASGAVAYGVQIPGLEDDKDAAAIAYQAETGVALDSADGCANAYQLVLDGDTNDNLVQLWAVCDKGQFHARLVNISIGVAAISAVAAGFLLYKGYLQKPDEDRDASATTIIPTITGDSVGAQVVLTF